MKAISIEQFIKRDNNNLDLIRVLCAYFVIYAHAFVLSPSDGSNDILYKLTSLGYVSFGGVAVKTFFLISGLLVTNSLLSNGNIAKYVSSRFFRVYPAFFVTVLISTLLIGPFMSNLSLSDYLSSREVWGYITKTLKFDVQYNLPGVFESNNLRAVNGSLWTIPMEVKAYFYLLLIYICSLAFGPYKKPLIGLVSLAILVEPFTPLKGHLIAKSDDPSIYLLYPFFSAGCLLALLKDRLTTNTLLITAVLSFVGFLAVSDEKYRTALFYLFFTMSLLYISSLKLIRKIRIGDDISYGVYLWAFPIQQATASFIIGMPYVNISISVILSSILAYISFKFIESPAMNFNRKLFKSKELPIGSY